MEPWDGGRYEMTDLQGALRTATWVLFVFAIICCFSEIGRIFSVLMDTTSLFIAAWLVFQRAPRASRAGWIRLAVELLTWMLGFAVLFYFMQAQEHFVR